MKKLFLLKNHQNKIRSKRMFLIQIKYNKINFRKKKNQAKKILLLLTLKSKNYFVKNAKKSSDHSRVLNIIKKGT